MPIPTNHLRLADGTLQQLFVYDADDAWLLSLHSLTDVDEEVFKEQPHHMVEEWLEQEVDHEWRAVPVKPARGELEHAAK